MNSLAKTAVELSVDDMDVLLDGLNAHTTDLCNKLVVVGPASRAVLCTKLDAATAIGQSLIDAQARLKASQACESMPAIDDDTNRPIVRPIYLVIEGKAYWLEASANSYFLCTAPISAFSGAVLWDDDTQVDPNANPKNIAIAKALAELVKRDDLLDALKAITQTFLDHTHYETKNPYSRPVVKDALKAIAEASGKSTFGTDWMNALE